MLCFHQYRRTPFPQKFRIINKRKNSTSYGTTLSFLAENVLSKCQKSGMETHILKQLLLYTHHTRSEASWYMKIDSCHASREGKVSKSFHSILCKDCPQHPTIMLILLMKQSQHSQEEKLHRKIIIKGQHRSKKKKNFCLSICQIPHSSRINFVSHHSNSLLDDLHKQRFCYQKKYLQKDTYSNLLS